MFGPPPVCRNCEYAYKTGVQVMDEFHIGPWQCQMKDHEIIDPESPGCDDFNYDPSVIQ